MTLDDFNDIGAVPYVVDFLPRTKGKAISAAPEGAHFLADPGPKSSSPPNFPHGLKCPDASSVAPVGFNGAHRDLRASPVVRRLS